MTRSPNVTSRPVYCMPLKSLLPSLWEFQEEMTLMSTCRIIKLCTRNATRNFTVCI